MVRSPLRKILAVVDDLQTTSPTHHTFFARDVTLLQVAVLLTERDTVLHAHDGHALIAALVNRFAEVEFPTVHPS
jgi:hypothetical protein